MELNLLFVLFSATILAVTFAELSLRLVIVMESAEPEMSAWVGSALRSIESARPGLKMDAALVPLDREDEEQSYRRLCAAASAGVSLLLDVSWSPWRRLTSLADAAGAPLARGRSATQALVAAVDSYLDARNATDAAYILPTENDVDRALYELLGASGVRVWMHAGLTRDAARALKNMRPDPSFYVVVGDSTFVMDTYRRAVREKLVRLDYRWNLVLTDYQASELDLSQLVRPTVLLSADSDECCRMLALPDDCACPKDFQREQYIMSSLLGYIADTYGKLEKDLPIITTAIDCDSEASVGEMNVTRDRLYRQYADDSEASNETVLYWDEEKLGLFLRSSYTLATFTPDDGAEAIAGWSAGEEFHLLAGAELRPLRMFFRVGTTPAVPWTMPKLDPESGEPLLTEEGQPVYEGYCIDLVQKMSEVMEFDYEIITPKSGTFGQKLPNGSWDGVVGDLARGVMEFDYEIITPKSGTFGQKLPNGSWDGVVGDLARGETDLVVAALTMTAEREEIIDFVAPYFDQTGIHIVIRKPARKTSLFKFMTVLRTEVWLSIVAALVLTGFMIWFLDKYSPYSARNNPEAYPYPCREFTLKESFWFALTSFTPQGGGEAPKALSGRTLVAAYWLFVVLMLATFTANLAAFLTVERMQTPVSSLEQLARQSRINYTVVEGSTVHQYFINMKFAEDTLYRVWKEITLNATSDQAQYRVWDYPIREQYGHILLAINASGPVADAATGFRQVVEHSEADFAFIHDSAEIKYEVTRNCNLTEVGDVFAEQPYAVAVQQGSRLQDQLSRTILDLQKERFLEELTSKYWNQTARSSCPDADESEGITLESLGGVFIATLFGLGLAMVTLAWEVFYYKRKERNKVSGVDEKVEKQPRKPKKTKKSPVAPKEAFTEQKQPLKEKMNPFKGKDRGPVKRVTIGDTFKPVSEKNSISYISVYPKGDRP